MTTDYLASQSLLERAYQSSKPSEFIFLLDTAYRLDNSIDREAITNSWMSTWMDEEKIKRESITTE